MYQIVLQLELLLVVGCAIVGTTSFQITPHGSRIFEPRRLNGSSGGTRRTGWHQLGMVDTSPLSRGQQCIVEKRGANSVLYNDLSQGDDRTPDQEGADLAAEFFKIAQQKGLSETDTSLDDDEDEDEEDDEDEDDEEVNIPQGAINAFLGYDTGDVGDKLAGNVSLTDNQLYSEVKDRVLDTAGGFVEFVGKSANDDDDDEMDDDDFDEEEKTKPYEPPTTIPDPELTAGEVVLLVLDALLHNDVPTPNRGVEILFGYSSPGSQIKNEVGLTPTEYKEFLAETEYKVVFDHQGVSIDKGDYSFNGKKAFFTARLKVGNGPLEVVSVNFILSSEGEGENSCWMVESMLIRPKSMRRRRRR